MGLVVNGHERWGHKGACVGNQVKEAGPSLLFMGSKIIVMLDPETSHEIKVYSYGQCSCWMNLE